MKKIMIAAAIVCAAAFAQAAQWKWSISSGDPLMQPGSEALTADSGTAYLFADLTSTQLSAIVSDFANGSLTVSGFEKSQGIAAGGVLSSAVSFDDTRTAGTTVNWTMVVTSNIDGQDYLFISEELPLARLADGKSKAITFKEFANSSAAALDATAGYAGAGWYQAVPEPTSGLLMLLGMAGLALRRRRA